MKKSITMKIIISYLVIVLASLTFVGVFFSVVTRNYAEKQARHILYEDAGTLQEVFKNALNKNISEARLQQLIRDKIKKIRALNSSPAVVAREDFHLIYPRTGEAAERFKLEILPLLQSRLGDEALKDVRFVSEDLEFMAVVRPIGAGTPGGVKGWIILYTPVAQVRELSAGMYRILILSLVLTAIPALLFGVFFARSIARPIILLKNRAEAVAGRDFDSRADIRTGDELEELGCTIDKMAEELKEYDIAQKKFLQNASHELKTPLMSIQGYAEGLKDGVFEDNNKALDIIIDESTRLKKLVEELIYLSKLETMEDFYRFTPESMNEVIEKSVEKVNSLALKSNIRINSIPYGDAVINMDRDKLTQALINILGNCIRHAHSEINIVTRNDGRNLSIIIGDDGEGFDDRDLNNAFIRFYKGKKGNTGLGMAITKVIVERHGGSVMVGNGAKGGAEFRVELKID
jgi:two-component system, OmpR family, sensor histidine kinase CssS